MDNIVKYHNDLNKLKFYLFGELEQNILMGVFLNARFHNTKEFILNADDIAKFLPQRNPSKQEIFNRVMSLRENLFKIDYTHEIKLDNGLIELSFYNIFSVFTLVYTTENREFEYLKIKISDDFSYLIHNLTKFMTQFELEEFLFLSGKYAKALYIHLKQFRTTGIWRVKWDDFKEILGIPSSYKMCDIDKQILKPSVKQLQEPNLFERARTPFKNLKYKKIKDPKGRGRGGKVIGIEFSFTPEPKRNEFKEIIQNLAKTEQEMEKESGREPKIHILTGEEVTELTPYISRHFSIKNQEYGGYDTCKIKDLKYIDKDDKKMVWALMLNQENYKEFEMFFDSIAHMKNALKLD